MQLWESASDTEARVFKAISLFLGQFPHLMSFLFDPQEPKLRGTPDALLAQARGLSSGELILIKLTLDLWSEQGHLRVLELFSLDADIFMQVLEAVKSLGPRPSPLLARLFDESTQTECRQFCLDEDLQSGA